MNGKRLIDYCATGEFGLFLCIAFLSLVFVLGCGVAAVTR